MAYKQGEILHIKIKELFNIEKGTLQSTKCIEGQYNFITASSEWKTHNEFTHDTEAIIIAVAASGSLGRAHYVNGKFISSDLCFILTPKSEKYPLDLSFYYFIFNSIRDDLVKSTATGTSKLAINKSNFGTYQIPYLDVSKQKEFKNKLVNITERKGQLVAINEKQTEIIQSLRQQILQDAITGKLSEKWRKENPNIESAEVLLEKVKAEKEKLVKEGKIRNQKPLPLIKENEKPFDLPQKWVWCRLQDLLQTIQYGTSVKCTTEKGEGMSAVLRIPNVSSGEVNLDDMKYAKLSSKEKDSLDLKKGDLLIIRSNGSKDIVGQATLIRRDLESFTYAGYLIRLRTFIETEYLLGCFRSNFLRSQIETPLRTTVGINNINSAELSSLLIPLPPRHEQNYIIKKLNILMHNVENLRVKNLQEIQDIEQLSKIILKDMFSE